MSLSGREFEDEVRRIARELWPAARFDGAKTVESRERDGVFETEWVTHLIEATTLRSKAKAEQDIDKLVRLRKSLVSRGQPVQAWFITQHEPTADQRAVTPKDGSVKVLSFEQFRSQLVDAHGYLRDRGNYSFGSARDPSTGAFQVSERYIPLPLLPAEATSRATLTVTSTVDLLEDGHRLMLLGDYGTGKSMTLRELHGLLAERYRKGSTTRFPIHLNLRDHHAQVDPVEALERHARLIGFPTPSQLVRAWRAGYAYLLLDGFDEIATPGWAGPARNLREIRRRSVELVRSFIRDTPAGVGVIIAGREHFFDSTTELKVALNLSPVFELLRVGEFSEEQINDYLQAHGWDNGLPDWLPSRPLLLAYLATHGLLPTTLDIPAGSAPAAAWTQLLNMICQREADIEANVEGPTLRATLERLASLTRENSDLLSPIYWRRLDFNPEIETMTRVALGPTPPLPRLATELISNTLS